MNVTNYWIARVLETRKFGHTYVHAAHRFHLSTDSIQTCGEIVFSYGGYGRSLQAGGNKYKAYAHYIYNKKPVPTKMLRSIINTNQKS